MRKKTGLLSRMRGTNPAMTRGRSVSLFAAALAIACGVAGASPARAEDQIVKLASVINDGWCLQPVNGSLNQGDAIVEEACDGSAAQQWTIPNVNCSTCSSFHLINGASHLCLDARGDGADGTPIQQWTCNSISNENWNFGPPPYNRLASSILHQTGGGPGCIVEELFESQIRLMLVRCNGDQKSFWKHPVVTAVWNFSVVYKDNGGRQLGETRTVTASGLADAVSKMPPPPPGATQQDVIELP